MARARRLSGAPEDGRAAVRRIGLILLAGGLVYLLLGMRFFVLPPADPLPAHASVAVLLGPATPQRIATAERLLETGRVDHLLISVPLDARTPGTRDFRRWADCDQRSGTTCAVAEPHTTQGEARLLRDEAVRHGWSSAILVTQTAHLERARLLFRRCFTGRITTVASGEPPDGGWPYQWIYQTAATAKAWGSPSC